MLRRQRSLIALIAGSSTTNLEREDAVPPLPSAGVYSNGIAADADARGGSVGKAGGGLFRRVSNLLRSGSRDNSHGSPTSARYRAASSTPDIHASGGSPVSSNGPSSGGGKLVKRPSVKARKEAQQRRMTGIGEGEGARDRDPGEEAFAKWRRTKSASATIKSMGVGTGVSSKSVKSVGVSSTKSKSSSSAPLPSSRSGSAYPSEDEGGAEEEEEDDIRRPSGLGRAASLREMERRSMARERERAVAESEPGHERRRRGKHTDATHTSSHAHDADSAYASNDSVSVSAASVSSTISSFSDGEDDDEDDIRRPSGLGRAAESLRLDDDEDDAPPTATRAAFPTFPHDSPSPSRSPNARVRAVSSPAEVQSKLTALHAILRLPPPPPSPSAFPTTTTSTSTPGSSSSTSVLNSASPSVTATYPSASALPNPSAASISASGLPSTIWARVLAHAPLPDAARAARVCGVLCGAARGRLYGVVDLRVGASSAFESAFESSADNSAFEARDGEGDAGHYNAGKEEEGEERGRKRREGKERALRMPHLAARVEGVVCAGWPPWEGEVGMEIHLSTLRSLTVFPPEDTSSRPSSAAPRTPTTPSPTSLAPRTPTAPRSDPTPALLAFLRAHPTIERLAIVGGEDSGFGDDDIPSSDVPHSQKQSDPQPFLPRLTHLHAPPALAVRLLEHIAAAPFCAPAPTPSRSSPSSPTTPPTKQSNSKPGLSAASLALLAPDPKRMSTSLLSTWGRRGHHPSPEADAADASVAVAPAPVTPPKQNRIPRKPPPVADAEMEDVVLGEKVELRRVGSVGRAARAVYVQARPAAAPVVINSAPAWVQSAPHPHPLRVVRIAVPRPLYEGAGAAGGGRVGRAVGGVLARGAGAPSVKSTSAGGDTGKAAQGVAVHLLFGPRVERRTLEKVLRTLGSALDEAVCASVSPSVNGKPPKEKAPPSAWAGRGREEPERANGNGKLAQGVALLEVRSPVRVAELYKVIAAVLPRYPALRTLLLTRPPDAAGSSVMSAPSVPPSPRSPSLFTPSMPGTPISPLLRVPPSPSIPPPPSPGLRAPPSPSFRAPPSPSLRAPPSPSSPHPPPSPAFTLAPPPGLRPSTAHPDAWAWEWDGWGDAGDVLAGVDAPALPLYALQQKALPEVPVGDDESVMFVDAGNYYTYGDAGGGGLSREDAAHVAAWRRRCAGLECVRMVSGAWWLRDG